MSVYTHVAVGAALGSLTANPAAAFVIGLAAHVPADLVSHYDFGRTWMEMVLAAAALGGFIWLGGGHLPVILGALGGVLPDAETLVANWRPAFRGRKYFPSHSGALAHGGRKSAADVLLQAAVVAVMAAWLYWAPSFA
jgi:hypothetical protein